LQEAEAVLDEAELDSKRYEIRADVLMDDMSRHKALESILTKEREIQGKKAKWRQTRLKLIETSRGHLTATKEHLVATKVASVDKNFEKAKRRQGILDDSHKELWRQHALGARVKADMADAEARCDIKELADHNPNLNPNLKWRRVMKELANEEQTAQRHRKDVAEVEDGHKKAESDMKLQDAEIRIAAMKKWFETKSLLAKVSNATNDDPDYTSKREPSPLVVASLLSLSHRRMKKFPNPNANPNPNWISRSRRRMQNCMKNILKYWRSPGVK